MRITFLIGSMGSVGGSERSVTLLANAWAEMGRAVTILTFDDVAVPAFPLHPSIQCRNLGLYGCSPTLLGRMRQIAWRHRLLRKAIRESRPDVVIGFTPEPNVRSILATRGLGIPVIVSERSDPPRYDVGWKWNALCRISYPFADRLVSQTQTALAQFRKTSKGKGRVIPNLIAVPPAGAHRRALERAGGSDRVLLAMGRLAPEKGFDLLLRAFARVIHRHPSWSLKILGEGELKNELQRLTDTLNLKGRVHFAGVRVEPFADLCEADLFVLSSRFEGFPNALAEAMACGLPAVSFDCPSGPRDIIRHGVDGLLVPCEDVDVLAAALDELMTDDAKRERFASRAGEILERFSALRVLSLWEEVLAELAPTAARKCDRKRTAAASARPLVE